MSDARVERLAGVLAEHDEPERMRVAPAERRMRYYRSQARALLPVVEQEIAAARAEALREAAEEAEHVERVGLTPANKIPADEREWFNGHPLRNVDGFQRHRPVIAAWLRDRAARIARTAAQTPAASEQNTETGQCAFTTTAGARCLLDNAHTGGHDPVGDDTLVDQASLDYDRALADYEGALGSRDPQQRSAAEQRLRAAERNLSTLQHRRVQARKWRQRGAPAATWEDLLYDPTQQFDVKGEVSHAVLREQIAAQTPATSPEEE